MLLGPGRRPAARTVCAAAVGASAVGLLLAPAVAAAASAASAAPSAAAGAAAASAPSIAAGAAAASVPSIAAVACRSGCAGGTVARGGVVRLRGRRLDRATAVVFLGGRGSRDDVRVPVTASAARIASATAGTRLDVRVPVRAVSGPVAVATADGRRSRPSRRAVRVVARTVAAPIAPVAVTLAPVPGLAVVSAGFAVRKSGAATTAVTIAYAVAGPTPTDVRVDVVGADDGTSVYDDARAAVVPGQRQTIAWDGRTDSGIAPDGRYELRITAGPGAATRMLDAAAGVVLGAAAPQGTPPPAGALPFGSFSFTGAVFPVQGAYSFGGSANRFGAGRAGHIHEGQDVLAKCGVPVVAARGGVVKARAYQSAAGNYVVIADPLTREGYLYAHLRAPATVVLGEHVATGQQLGVVGQTGDATTCHLHFELWTAPGWYAGGAPIDPLPALRSWSRAG